MGASKKIFIHSSEDLFADNFPFDFATVNEHVFLINSNKEFFQEYLFFTLNQSVYFNIMQNLGKAKAAQPGLNQYDLKSIPIIIPSSDILRKFYESVDTPLHELFNNAKQIQHLTALRDELLPLLMNGQVKVE